MRNACTEVTSADDSDVYNLGSINMGRVEDIREMAEVVELATKFLICGTLKAKLPYDKVELTRAKNRRLGLGLMGMHEWLIQRREQYEDTTEFHNWLSVYKGFLTKSPKQPQTDSQSAGQLQTEQSLRQALLVYLPVVALGLSLYLLFLTDEDICEEILGDTNTSSIPLPPNSSIVMTPILNP